MRRTELGTRQHGKRIKVTCNLNNWAKRRLAARDGYTMARVGQVPDRIIIRIPAPAEDDLEHVWQGFDARSIGQ
jgi:hypothetical protein